jgi:hypothetical protein
VTTVIIAATVTAITANIVAGIEPV